MYLNRKFLTVCGSEICKKKMKRTLIRTLIQKVIQDKENRRTNKITNSLKYYIETNVNEQPGLYSNCLAWTKFTDEIKYFHE